MSYQIRFSDPSNYLTIEDNTVNTELSLGFVGKHYINYAPVISENFLHLLENFSSVSAPVNPVKGQIWFNSEINDLNVYNGTNWKLVGVIQKSASPPSNPNIGDLWVNVNSKQLKMYIGPNELNQDWLLIGPEHSLNNTGMFIDTLYDNSINPEAHDVILLSVYKETELTTPLEVIAIISRDEFIPKSYTYLPNISIIKKGINLISADAKFWGTALNAENLIVNNEPITAETFLRSDQNNIVAEQFIIENDNGLLVGDSSKFAITTNSTSTEFHSYNNEIVVKVNNTTPIFYIKKTGIGINKFNPSETLDVNGTVKITGSLEIVLDEDNPLITVNKNSTTVNTIFNAKNIVIEKVDYNTNLHLLSEESTRQFNSNGIDIGYLEEESFLSGAWVGTSVSTKIGINATESTAEQFIMSISKNGSVIIDGFRANAIGSRLIDLNRQSGKLTRISVDLPYIYFYSVTNNSSEYGCQLYTVLANRSGDLCTFTLLSNNSCEYQELYWKKITFFKITNDSNNFDNIKAAIEQINQNWKN